jgi:hypothetical protein
MLNINVLFLMNGVLCILYKNGSSAHYISNVVPLINNVINKLKISELALNQKVGNYSF